MFSLFSFYIEHFYQDFHVGEKLHVNYAHIVVFTSMFLWFTLFLLSVRHNIPPIKRASLWTLIILSLFHCIFAFLQIKIPMIAAFTLRLGHLFWQLTPRNCIIIPAAMFFLANVLLRVCIIFHLLPQSLVFVCSESAQATLPLLINLLSSHFSCKVVSSNVFLAMFFFAIVGHEYYIEESEVWAASAFMLNFCLRLGKFDDDKLSRISFQASPITLEPVHRKPQVRIKENSFKASNKQVLDLANNLVRQNNNIYRKAKYTFPMKAPNLPQRHLRPNHATEFPTGTPIKEFISSSRRTRRRKYVVRMIDDLMKVDTPAENDSVVYERFYGSENV